MPRPRSVPPFGNLLLALTLLSAAVTTHAQDAIAPVGEVELVQDGFTFTEGPAWDPETETLYFSDIPNKTIFKLSTDGEITPFTTDSKHTNGILVTHDGRLLGCQMDGQLVEYDKKDASATALADKFAGRRFNAPNDLVMDASGGVFFTDPLFRAPTPLPQTVQSVYYVAANGKVTRVTKDLPAPNGIGLSPDGSRLYVCPSRSAEMFVYEVRGGGQLSPPKVFCTVEQPAGQSDTGADGIVLDEKGNVYITTHIGVQIFSPEGKQLGVVKFPEQPANVTFGGKDWKTMYVTARKGLYRVQMPIAGLH
ncbi:MAG: SMP-30/gluconolactonase/LRE family protein [Planctomycetota bacterium]